MKSVEQYFSVVLQFIVLHKMALTFDSMDEILKISSKILKNPQNKSFRLVPLCDAVYYSVQDGSNF